MWCGGDKDMTGQTFHRPHLWGCVVFYEAFHYFDIKKVKTNFETNCKNQDIS